MEKIITVAILSGGKSRRFGSNKIFAEYHGVRLIDQACRIAEKISKNVIIIGDQINLPNNSIPIYEDIFKNRGPLGAIHSALKNAITRWIFLLPGDMPLMDPKICDHLFKYDSLNVPIVGISHSGLEPLVSIWPISALKVVERRLNEKQNSPIQALLELCAKEVHLPSVINDYRGENFQNINTQKDLELLNQKKIDQLEPDGLKK